MPSIVPAETATEIVKAYQRGEHTGELTKRFPWSKTTIRRVLREAGITPDRRRSGAASWTRRNNLPPDEGDLITGYRWCSECRERKPMDDFYWRNIRGASPATRCRRCKPCQYRYVKAGANLRANRRRHLYGMSPDEYDRLFGYQGGACAICREPARDEEGRGLHVDHDHHSGAVRGLLCGSCNQGLGRFRDNPDYLHAAAWYLERQGLDFGGFPVRVEDSIGQAYLAMAG
jgi:hypothetical protein